MKTGVFLQFPPKSWTGGNQHQQQPWRNIRWTGYVVFPGAPISHHLRRGPRAPKGLVEENRGLPVPGTGPPYPKSVRSTACSSPSPSPSRTLLKAWNLKRGACVSYEQLGLNANRHFCRLPPAVLQFIWIALLDLACLHLWNGNSLHVESCRWVNCEVYQDIVNIFFWLSCMFQKNMSLWWAVAILNRAQKWRSLQIGVGWFWEGMIAIVACIRGYGPNVSKVMFSSKKFSRFPVTSNF